MFFQQMSVLSQCLVCLTFASYQQGICDHTAIVALEDFAFLLLNAMISG